MPVLYLQSRFLYLIVYYLIGYRKKVVQENLEGAFPEASPEQIHTWKKEYYRHFCDLMVEIVKLMSISEAGIQKRVQLLNPEAINEMLEGGRGGIAVFSHFGNWEWLAAGLGPQLPFPTYGVYKPLSNKAVDQLMLHIRSRLGNRMIEQKDTYRSSLELLNSPCYIGFLGDQNPAREGKLYFTSFLGRPAPAHLGIATIALRLKAPLYYFDLRRLRRGQYTIELVKIPNDDLMPFSKENVYKLTDRHVAYLESVIRDNPPYWLWSHRRWKHQPRDKDICSENLK